VPGSTGAGCVGAPKSSNRMESGWPVLEERTERTSEMNMNAAPATHVARVRNVVA